jgi:hypothetical protein
MDVHGLMVAIQHIQAAACPLRLLLQPLQPVQQLQLLRASV